MKKVIHKITMETRRINTTVGEVKRGMNDIQDLQDIIQCDIVEVANSRDRLDDVTELLNPTIDRLTTRD